MFEVTFSKPTNCWTDLAKEFRDNGFKCELRGLAIRTGHALPYVFTVAFEKKDEALISKLGLDYEP